MRNQTLAETTCSQDYGHELTATHPHMIPDDWLSEAGLVGFVPSQRSFRCDEPHVLVPLVAIEPIMRNEGVTLDANGFRRDRMMSILHGIRRSESIPPIEVEIACAQRRTYRLRDGFHRYYASFWLNFEAVPADIVPSY
jgi:hypothetical protein